MCCTEEIEGYGIWLLYPSGTQKVRRLATTAGSLPQNCCWILGKGDADIVIVSVCTIYLRSIQYALPCRPSSYASGVNVWRNDERTVYAHLYSHHWSRGANATAKSTNHCTCQIGPDQQNSSSTPGAYSVLVLAHSAQLSQDDPRTARAMGRRAKNKQGAPEPLADVNGESARPSAKKLGKRKAVDDARESVSKRPAKKMKETVQKKGAKKVKAVTGKKQKEESEDEEGEDDEDVEEGGSEGWEDVDDDLDVKAEARCVRRVGVCSDYF